MPDLEAKWYVIHTYSGYENKVAGDLMTTAENRQLQDMIIDVKVPTEIVTETVGDKTKEVEHKIYPGYVFVKMVYTDETWYVVRNIRGCTGFVGPGSKPVPLTDAEVYRMGVLCRHGRRNRHRQKLCPRSCFYVRTRNACGARARTGRTS